MASIQKVTPCMWFDRQAEEAAKYYTSIFKNSSIGTITRYGKEGFEVHHMPEGTVLTVEFFLDGQQYIAINGGPAFKFNESVSLIVNCETQEEVDYYWEKLSQGGDEKAQVCGWLKDRYGLSWQVVPVGVWELWRDEKSAGYQRAMKAMMQMKKLDINQLKQAYEGKQPS